MSSDHEIMARAAFHQPRHIRRQGGNGASSWRLSYALGFLAIAMAGAAGCASVGGSAKSAHPRLTPFFLDENPPLILPAEAAAPSSGWSLSKLWRRDASKSASQTDGLGEVQQVAFNEEFGKEPIPELPDVPTPVERPTPPASKTTIATQRAGEPPSRMPFFVKPTAPTATQPYSFAQDVSAPPPTERERPPQGEQPPASSTQPPVYTNPQPVYTTPAISSPAPMVETPAQTIDATPPISFYEGDSMVGGNSLLVNETEECDGNCNHWFCKARMRHQRALGRPSCGFLDDFAVDRRNGHAYGKRVRVRDDFPRELRMASQPMYMVEPPDRLRIDVTPTLPDRPLQGERVVRPDGTVSLGFYGQIHVAGLTLPEVSEKVRERIAEYVSEPHVAVDLVASESKSCYVVGQVARPGKMPITGNDTVLDAIAHAGGLTTHAFIRHIHVARPSPGGACDQILPVDYKGIVDAGDTRTNFQLLPGDRIVVPSTPGFRRAVMLDSWLMPIERIIYPPSMFRYGNTDSDRLP